MKAYRDGDRIIAPRRAEGTDALGDAWVALEPGASEYEMWDEWLRQQAERVGTGDALDAAEPAEDELDTEDQ